MRKFYNIVSFVFQPLLMPTFGMAMLISMNFFDVIPLVWRIVAIFGTFLFTGLMPAAPILIMLKRGGVSDLFISKREQRTMPYVFSIISYAFWALFLFRVLKGI